MNRVKIKCTMNRLKIKCTMNKLKIKRDTEINNPKSNMKIANSRYP